MKKHKYELGQEVRIVGDCSHQGCTATIIALNIKDAEFYASDYTVAVHGKYESQYKNMKAKKYHVEEDYITAIKVINIYAYEDFDGELHYYSQKLSDNDLHSRAWARVPGLNFSKEVQS